MLQSVGHPKRARSIDLRLDQGAHCSTWTRIYSDTNRPLKSLYCQTDQLKESVWEEQLVWVCLMALRRVAQFWVVWCCLTCSCSSHVKCGDAAVLLTRSSQRQSLQTEGHNGPWQVSSSTWWHLSEIFGPAPRLNHLSHLSFSWVTWVHLAIFFKHVSDSLCHSSAWRSRGLGLAAAPDSDLGLEKAIHFDRDSVWRPGSHG
jgi:hypothetical protein